MKKELIFNIISTVLLSINIFFLSSFFLGIPNFGIFEKIIAITIRIDIEPFIVMPIFFILALVLGILSRNTLWGKIIIGITCLGCLIYLLALGILRKGL